MTPVGVFFCWQGGAERDFVNSTILGRAMGIEPIENPDLTKYADAAQVVSNNLLSQLVSVE